MTIAAATDTLITYQTTLTFRTRRRRRRRRRNRGRWLWTCLEANFVP